MAIKALAALSEEEVKKVVEAPAVITVLIAAADDNIDEDETSWASKVVDYRKTIGDESLFDYYEASEEAFAEALSALLNEEVVGNQERLANMTAELEALNPILKKINRLYAQKLVNSWRSFAKQVAKASGGILGFGSVSKAEEALVDLDMIEIK